MEGPHLTIFDAAHITTILSTYGYYAVFLVVMLESAGIPMPGETVLVTAAIYASTKHQLDIRFIILAAAVGAIAGDNIGFWIGRAYGKRVLRRWGPKIGLDERKQKLGEFLFMKYGGLIVFFGRFVAMLRAYAALLAGINRLQPTAFFLYNAAGGIVWAVLFGVGGYLLGTGIEHVAGPLGYVALAIALVGAIALWRFYKKNEEALLDRAVREMDAQPTGSRASAR